MLRYVIRRVLWALLLFVVVTFATYAVFFLIPADVAKLFAGKSAGPDEVARAAHFYGLDRPWYVQYGKFMYRLSPFGWQHGQPIAKAPSLGFSFANRQSVNSVVLDAAPVTASLVIGGAIVWMLIALPIGIISALRPRSLLDRGGMVFVLVGISAHPVWIGLILAWLFGFKLHVTPISGYADFFYPISGDGGPVQWAYHLVLPWVTFAVLFAALYARMIRANVVETLNEDYVRTARAKGAPEWVVLRSHVLRNAMLPIVTMLGMDVAIALGGNAIFTESIYGLPGLGRHLRTSLDAYDFPVTVGIVVFATVVILTMNLIVDLVYAAIDPRIRLS